MNYYPTFPSSSRLDFRIMDLSDAAFFMELVNTPKWIEFIGERNVKSIADAEKYIQDKMISSYEKYGFGNYAIILKDTNQVIGSVGLYKRPDFDYFDVGYALMPAFENQGYTSEAVKEILNFARQTLKHNKVLGFTAADHVASQRVLIKNGLSFIKEFEYSGDLCYLYSIDL